MANVRIKKILYATDMSKPSVPALAYAARIALCCGAELHCIHVLDLEHEFFIEGGYIAPLVLKAPLPTAQLKKKAGKELARFMKKHLPSRCKVVDSKVILGKPFEGIIRYARAKHMDMIVLGTHGHSALASMLMGSVAEKVVRKARCAVLTVRHPKHKFVAP